jgi:hypothetical protein
MFDGDSGLEALPEGGIRGEHFLEDASTGSATSWQIQLALKLIFLGLED